MVKGEIIAEKVGRRKINLLTEEGYAELKYDPRTLFYKGKFIKYDGRKKGWRGESVRHGMSARGLPSGRKKKIKTPVKQHTLGDEEKHISKLKDTALLKQFSDQDFLQFEYGQTSRWDALTYGLLEKEIKKRGLEEKAGKIIERNEKKADKLREKGEI